VHPPGQRLRLSTGAAVSSTRWLQPGASLRGDDLPLGASAMSALRPARALVKPTKEEVSSLLMSQRQEHHGFDPSAFDVKMQSHIKIFRQLQYNWQAYDAYCRISLAIGVNHTLYVVSYYALAYLMSREGIDFSAIAAVCVAIFTGLTIFKLELFLSSPRMRVMKAVFVTGPLMSVTGCEMFRWVGEGNEMQRVATWLPAALAAAGHAAWLVVLLHHAQPTAAGRLPEAFRSVGHLDVFEEEKQDVAELAKRRICDTVLSCLDRLRQLSSVVLSGEQASAVTGLTSELEFMEEKCLLLLELGSDDLQIPSSAAHNFWVEVESTPQVDVGQRRTRRLRPHFVCLTTGKTTTQRPTEGRVFPLAGFVSRTNEIMAALSTDSRDPISRDVQTQPSSAPQRVSLVQSAARVSAHLSKSLPAAPFRRGTPQRPFAESDEEDSSSVEMRSFTSSVGGRSRSQALTGSSHEPQPQFHTRQNDAVKRPGSQKSPASMPFSYFREGTLLMTAGWIVILCWSLAACVDGTDAFFPWQVSPRRTATQVGAAVLSRCRPVGTSPWPHLTGVACGGDTILVHDRSTGCCGTSHSFRAGTASGVFFQLQRSSV